MRQVRSKVSWFVLLFAFGCEASFTDLRPAPLDPPRDQDAGFPDFGPPPDMDQAILQGTFAGRSRYNGAGAVSLVQRTDGSFELVFGDDFSVSSVPGPVVVLTTRSSIGSSIQENQGDIDLGALQRNSGSQVYQAPAAAVGAMYAWVFCRPFGVEISRAPLAEVSR